MRNMRGLRVSFIALAYAALAGLACAATEPGQVVPTGVRITPDAAPGSVFQSLNPHLSALPDFRAGQASAMALSPDRKTLLILTSGFNRNFTPEGAIRLDASSEYLFVWDLSGAEPKQVQVLTLANSFLGLAWAPSGKAFYVSGGVDDAVLEFRADPAGFQPGRKFSLGHKAGLGLKSTPEAAGLALSPDGRRLLVANMQNDSVSLIDLASGVTTEQDLRPGAIDPARRGAPGGTFPRSVAFTANDHAWVGSERDREVISLKLSDTTISVGRRIHTRGRPTALLSNASGGRLFVAADSTDEVLVIDPASARVIEAIPSAAPKALMRPGAVLGGVNTNGLALSPDQRTLLASNGGENAIAVIQLSDRSAGLGSNLHPLDADGDGDGDDEAKAARPPSERSTVVGLIPTGWYPTAVAADARRLYVVNGKSNSGPNGGGCRDSFRTGPGSENACRGTNQYVWQLEKAGFLTLPIPSPARLGALTRQVAENNRFKATAEDRAADAVLEKVRQRIRHVIYIVKENRTYDQVLGDLGVGDSDPKLNLFPRALGPNHHAIARQFVDLDRFFDSGESSNTGWNWTTAARTTDFTEREAPVNYADRGLQYDQEGSNRNINVGIGDEKARAAANPSTPADPDLLAGSADVAAPDGPDGAIGQGYLWDAALRAGLTLRNYGFYGDLSRYALDDPNPIPRERDPHARGMTVFYPTKPALLPVSDPWFRSFDQAYPDFWRFQEWKREFDDYARAAEAGTGDLPQLTLLRLAHDHFGAFGKGLDGVDTVETEFADNDYAVGLVLQTVAASRFGKDTLIFIVEDDAQDGADHVDSHRSIALIAGPYVKQGQVVSHRYTTVNLVKTIESVLGLAPMGLNDALAAPMAEVFDLNQAGWSYRAEVPHILRTTALPLPKDEASSGARGCLASRSSAWWAAVMKGQNFASEDHLDTPRFNKALWRGMMADKAACAAK